MNNNLKMPKKKRKKKKSIGYKIFMSFLIILLAIIIIGTGYLVGTLNKLDNTKVNKDNLGIKTEDFTNYDTKNIKNIALFGIDATDSNSGRSDSIMVATIDSKHKKLKITSIMRDSYVNIEGYGNDKINHAYAYGGPELSLNTINQNFGLNIENYATVDFSSLPAIINLLGGIDIEITNDELGYINDYISSLNSVEGTNSPGIYSSGLQHLDGIQALAYSRIRYTAGGDYERTQRHRTVLNSLFKTLVNKPVTSYPAMLSEILPYVQTNLGTSEILSIGTDVLSIGNNLEQDRFPRDVDAVGTSIDGVYYLTFDRETVKQEMKNYIFNDIK
ncbi:LCP family protein [Clostridium sp.]|uniref:LCP family protein n=1 Tax=Clostridium sp. TaxID=1506 RepID=UPI0026057708|nr:LCP family protein [Clostridium sp.]